jgi:hypothetical protein
LQTRTEDAQAEKRQCRQNEGERILDRRLIATKTLGELRKKTRADADDDSEHKYLHAGGDHIAQDFFGEEGGLVKKAEGKRVSSAAS